ncbi:MAG TPA: serine/threonine protein kinase [Rhodocyclaceae bacterium]
MPPPYDRLTPDLLLDALETLGLDVDGRLLALNSFENRVYQVGIYEGAPLVVKFYRPQRWSDGQILEEHAYTAELLEAELPVVAPLKLAGRTLHSHEGFRFAVYPRQGGRPPELDQPGTLAWMGRLMARIHAVGRRQRFKQRQTLSLQSYGTTSLATIRDGDFLPPELADIWLGVAEQALEGVARCFEQAGAKTLRLHGDCHSGNVLWTDEGPHFVDFDDSCSGPAVQDLWMLLSGDAEAMAGQLRQVLEGYEQFVDFDRSEVYLIEALRTLRLIHYSAWIAKRWDDPAFPAAFPWFGSPRYWQDRILELREQLALLENPGEILQYL